MSWFMVDVEADGPCPGMYSMTEIGVVLVDREAIEGTPTTFHGYLQPQQFMFEPDALKSIGQVRPEQFRAPFTHPTTVMYEFVEWVERVNGKKRPMFISDNNGFDWQFVNYYMHRYTGSNPFGWSSTNLGSLYKGLVKDQYKSFKKYRRTPHDHNPVNDSLGNVEALYVMVDKYGLKGFS